MGSFSMIHFTRTAGIRLLATLALLLFSGWAVAQGGAPLVTDDPGTPGDGKWEINLASTGGRTSRGWDLNAVVADINYGLGDNIELKLEVPWTYVHESGGPWKSGLGSGSAGMKWRFLDRDENSDGGFAASIYPQYETAWSDASIRKGVAGENDVFFLPIQIATAVGGFEFAAEVGRSFVQNESDEWEAGIAAAHGCGSVKLECLVEVHRTWAPGSSQTLLNFGIRYQINDSLVFLTSAGRDFGPRTEEQQQFVYYAGLRILR